LFPNNPCAHLDHTFPSRPSCRLIQSLPPLSYPNYGRNLGLERDFTASFLCSSIRASISPALPNIHFLFLLYHIIYHPPSNYRLERRERISFPFPSELNPGHPTCQPALPTPLSASYFPRSVTEPILLPQRRGGEMM